MKKLSLFLLLTIFAGSELNGGFQGYEENGKAKLTRKQRDSVVAKKFMDITRVQLKKRTAELKREMAGQELFISIVRNEDGVQTIIQRKIKL